jgi:N-acetylglutamate synthase-like GNAT family acetyltransferase
MVNYTDTIRLFLLGSNRNCWLNYPDFHVYVRKGYHRINQANPVSMTFDIANIDVEARQRGKGIFTDWLTLVERETKSAGLEAVYVENVLNPRLADFLTRRGYTKLEGGIPSFYLLT